MSHSAMSIALIAQAYTLSAGKNPPRNITCHRRSVCHGSAPTTSSLRCSTARAIDPPQLRMPASPRPWMPASVSILTMK